MASTSQFKCTGSCLYEMGKGGKYKIKKRYKTPEEAQASMAELMHGVKKVDHTPGVGHIRNINQSETGKHSVEIRHGPESAPGDFSSYPATSNVYLPETETQNLKVGQRVKLGVTPMDEAAGETGPDNEAAVMKGKK